MYENVQGNMARKVSYEAIIIISILCVQFFTLFMTLCSLFKFSCDTTQCERFVWTNVGVRSALILLCGVWLKYYSLFILTQSIMYFWAFWGAFVIMGNAFALPIIYVLCGVLDMVLGLFMFVMQMLRVYTLRKNEMIHPQNVV